jgi:hypothetical protein
VRDDSGLAVRVPGVEKIFDYALGVFFGVFAGKVGFYFTIKVIFFTFGSSYQRRVSTLEEGCSRNAY